MKPAAIRLLTVREAAEQLSLSIASVYEMVRTCRRMQFEILFR
jgi:predicted DNA-binding transcriptional regulator AlpA